MKVALILTGHMRDWKEVYPTIREEILIKYDVDVYISSFDHDLDSIRQEGDIVDDREKDTEKIDLEEIKHYYQPVKSIFRSNNYELNFNFNKIVNERIPREWAKRNIQGWETVYLSLNIINLNDYDFIIRSRPDVFIKNLEIDPNKNLVFPHLCIDPGPCTINEGLYSHFAYGKPEYMKKYLEVYTKLQEMHSKGMTDISVREMTLKDYVKNYIGMENIHIDEDIEWKYKDTAWSLNLMKAQNLILLDSPQGWFETGTIDEETFDSIMSSTEMGESNLDGACIDCLPTSP